MATAALRAESARVITSHRFPPAAAARVASRMLDRFNRDELGNAIEVLVALLDVWDGDPDLEDDDVREDDDPAGLRDEDEVNTGGAATFGWAGPQGAGCPISDPDSEHDGREPDYGDCGY